MDKSELDLSLFLYSPFDKKTVTKLEQYDEFKVDFGVDKAKFISYVILLFDFNTPLRKEVQLFYRRKAEAAIMAGFKIAKGRFDKEVEDMLIGENKECNIAISRYLSLFGLPEYMELMGLESMLAFEMQNALKFSESQDFQVTRKNMKELTERINELTLVLFGGKEALEARKALYEFTEKDRLRIRPEHIAEDLEAGKPILDGYNPYGEYKPSKLKFTNKPKS